MDCQTNPYRLNLEGTAQNQRPPFALHPQYVRIDEHTTAEWMVFARLYARFLQFYAPNHTADGDWSVFYDHNPAMVTANLAAARVDWFREEIRLVIIELQKLDQQADTLLLRQHFNRLFDMVANLALRLDEHFRRLPSDQPFRQVLGNLIQTSLAPALQNWIGWHRKASQAGPAPYPLTDPGTSKLQQRLLDQTVLGEALLPAANIWTNHDFSPEWLRGGAPDWATYRNSIFADAAAGAYDEVFGSDVLLPDAAGKINFAIRHFFFTNAHETFLKGFAQAAAEAAKALNLLLSWNRHEPHLALFFAFLRLLEHERDALNTFTQRHLAFYYRDVLRLNEKKAVPGQAFVVFELAKHIEQHLLAAGLKLKAGKDADNKDVLYALMEDLVANKATIAEMRCVFKAPGDPALYQFSPDRPAYRATDAHRYFAAPIAHSADGLGADLTSTDKQWRLFGNKTVVSASGSLVWNIDIPRADVGFALASNFLFLQEGARTISLRVDGANTAPLNNRTFRVRLTTEKGWHETQATFSGNTLTVALTGEVPAILPYNAKVHGGAYPTTFPVMECRLPNQDGQTYAYESLKNLKTTNLHLSVAVTGKKNLALSGSTGPLENNKPFHPFGAAPGHGAVFYVGDKEVFQKNAAVTLHLLWKEVFEYSEFFDPHTYGGHAYTRFGRLAAGQWSDQSGNVVAESSPALKSFSFSVGDTHRIEPDFSVNTHYQSGSAAGFVRFVLNRDWGHNVYGNALSEFAVNGGTGPRRLYDPQVLEFSLDYTAQTDIPLNSVAGFEDQSGRLLHLHPFGFATAAPDPLGGASLLPVLVPQFALPDNTVGKDGGEFYLGIKGLDAPQILSLLVQMADGSADPLLEKPQNHVVWSYLKGDAWIDFEAGDVADGTLGLLQSGLVRLAVPREADTVHNLLPSGLHWVRARVSSAVDAVCNVIGIHTQGVRTQRAHNGNAAGIDAVPLAANSIAKLLEPQSAVKKAEQPYAGFGNKAAETTGHFTTRVSERLRHKNRGIALWDYERLVLEEFPFVHRARCLNHLRFEPSGNQFLYRELAPGHVTLILVSNLRNRNAVNPLRPYTKLSDLKNIHDWLQKRLSCFVTLHVRNPLFESVRAEFNVKFFPGYDETFYLKKLNDDIVRFLSPWAFDEGEELVFGGKMHKSTLVNFIEEQPYVDYLTDLKLIHQTNPPKPDQETVEPSTQCSVLVSAEQHGITAIHEETAGGPAEDCGCGLPQTTGNA